MDSKELIASLMKDWEAFKKENDAAMAAKADVGHVSTELQAKVDKIDSALTEKHAAIMTRLDEQEAEFNRLRIFEETEKSSDLKALKESAHDFSLMLSSERKQKIEVSTSEMKAYRSAFFLGIRGDFRSLGAEEQAALRVGVDPDGGYYVPADTSGRMVKLIYESSPMRQIAGVQNIGTDALEGMYDHNEVSQGWVGEEQPRSETTTPQIGVWRIPVREQYAEPRATQKILDDAAFNIEAWLQSKVADKMARTETTSFFLGTGALKPRGILTYDHGAPTASDYRKVERIPSGKDADFAATLPGNFLINLVFKLKNAYRANARFLMTRLSVSEVRKLVDGSGNYLWQPEFSAKQGGLLLGYPILEAEDMPEIASDSLSIAFGDFKQFYQIVDRMGIRVLRDPLTLKGFVKFYSTKRVGGDVLDFDAVKLMRFATTAE